MNKLISIILFVLFAFSANAQPQDSQLQMQTLVQKVDSLAHELSYLKLTYEINTLNSDLISFKNDVYATALDVQINLYNRNFNRKLGRVYRDYYRSCESKRESFEGLVKAKKDLFVIMTYTQQYTESELNLLMRSYGLIDDILDSLDKSMSLLKISIDAYEDML